MAQGWCPLWNWDHARPGEGGLWAAYTKGMTQPEKQNSTFRSLSTRPCLPVCTLISHALQGKWTKTTSCLMVFILHEYGMCFFPSCLRRTMGNTKQPWKMTEVKMSLSWKLLAKVRWCLLCLTRKSVLDEGCCEAMFTCTLSCVRIHQSRL